MNPWSSFSRYDHRWLHHQLMACLPQSIRTSSTPQIRYCPRLKKDQNLMACTLWESIEVLQKATSPSFSWSVSTTPPGSLSSTETSLSPAKMLDVRLLWKAPDVNPVNQKARSIPALNPANVYGRVFTFAWFGFMVAFMSCMLFLCISNAGRRYAFPPLVWYNLGIRGKLFLQSHQVFTLILHTVEHYHCQRSQTSSGWHCQF